MTAESGRRCAVLGSPIAHSLSPELHRAAYAALGLDWTYGRVEVRARELPWFVNGLDESWRGLSLTMPLKTAVLGLGEVDDLARLAGAGNTLVLGPSGRRVYNTDVGGLLASVGAQTSDPIDRVTILGSGATARSALVSASRLGASDVAVLARTPERAAALVEMGRTTGMVVTAYPWTTDVPVADLLISTVPPAAAAPLAAGAAASAPVVFDAIYEPWPTPLAAAAERRGRTVISGLDLLVHQAVLQVELMTGRTVPPDVLYAALPTRLVSVRRRHDNDPR